MPYLNLFPPNVPFVNADGTLTKEAYRALQIVFERVGGAQGDSGFTSDPPVDQGFSPDFQSDFYEDFSSAANAAPPPDVFVPPSTAANGDLGLFPMQWPTRNPRGDGSWTDLWVPDQKTFADNVLSLRNNSRAPDGSIYGLAAICMLDAGGTERGAFGYSRNSLLQPAGYYADTVFMEYGDPFAGDNTPSSFKLICTMAATSPWFPGTSFIAMEADAKTGATVIRSRGGQPIALVGGYTLTDDLSVGYTGNTRQVLGGMTSTSWRIRERGTPDYCSWTTNIDDAGTQDDPTKPSWKVSQGAGTDEFRVSRAPAGSSTFTNFLRIDATGAAIFTGGEGVGYGAGSGGVVTQLTSKTTAVTINKPSGQITLNNAALAGGAIALFLVNNSKVTTSDCVTLNLRSGMAFSPNYTIRISSIESGGFYVVLKNETAGALSEAVVFNFNVMKGAIT